MNDSDIINPDVTYGDYDLLEQFQDDERAMQLIRDNLNEEPVNFFEPARCYDDWKKEHEQFNDFKKKMAPKSN